MIGARCYERVLCHRDRRNGTYLRQLVTSMGAVEVSMPRTRHSVSPVDVLGRYKRRTDEVDEAITAAYVRGVLTRSMGEVTEALMGENVGRSTVSRVTARLDERVGALRNAPIDQPIPYLYLDATFLDGNRPT